VLTTREAKRSFGFIGSGAILGWIVGGFATRTAVSQFGTESMLGFVAITLLLCAGLVVMIWRDRPEYVGNETPASGKVKDRFPLWGALRLIRESAYLRAIASLILIAALTTTIAGWQFKASRRRLCPTPTTGDVLRHLQHDRRRDVAGAAVGLDRPRGAPWASARRSSSSQRRC
jgi:AAA family ATP:ADP antiporter